MLIPFSLTIAESSSDAAELKLADLAKHEVIKVGDILAYSRRFPNLDITVEKDLLVCTPPANPLPTHSPLRSDRVRPPEDLRPHARLPVRRGRQRPADVYAPARTAPDGVDHVRCRHEPEHARARGARLGRARRAVLAAERERVEGIHGLPLARGG
jgi:hypothetical protein